MAANTNIFVLSTDIEGDCAPTPNVVMRKRKVISEIAPVDDTSTTDSDAEQASMPVVKKNRTTIRGCNRNLPRLPLEDVSDDSLAAINIYTKPVNIGLFNIKTFTPEIDADDVDEDEMVITLSKNSKKPASFRRAIPAQKAKAHTTCVTVESDEEVDDVTITISDTSPVRDRSPTPPPSGGLNRRQMRKRRPRTPKGVTQAIGHLESLRGRLQMRREHDKYEADDDDVICIDSPLGNKTLTVKLRSMHGIQRIPMKPMESFEGVIKEMAELEGVPVEHIALYFGDHIVQPYDTPRRLKLTIADILDCHIIRHRADDSDNEEDDNDDDDLDDPSMVRLRVRGQDKRITTLTIRIKRTDPLEKLMREYAMKCSFAFKTLKFSFDGDAVKRGDTAETLDMQDDDCIDVTRL